MDYETTTTTFNYLPIIYLVIGIIVAAVLIQLIRRLSGALMRPEMYGVSRKEIKESWENIKKTSGQGMMGAKIAIMEADALLDSALKSMSMPGMSMADRLRVARYKYPKLNKVWWAHKLRNQLVHESSFQLGSRQAKQALEEYERAFKTMNLL